MHVTVHQPYQLGLAHHKINTNRRFFKEAFTHTVLMGSFLIVHMEVRHSFLSWNLASSHHPAGIVII